jgi:hypothetical protein
MERIDEKQKQLVITRQSQLKLIMDYSRLINKPFKFQEMIGMSEALVKYCLEGRTEQTIARVKEIDKHISSLFVEE